MPSPSKQKTDKELYDQYLKVRQDVEQAWVVFAPRNYQSRVNLSFCQGAQWTLQEKIAFEVQGRIPYVFDQIGPKINHLIGTQQSTRLDASVLAMEQGDEEMAGILSKLVKWAEQMNRIEQVESSVFYDAAVKAVGVSQVRWAMKDIVNGFPCVEHIPVWQMLWDLSSTEPDASDMRWMARCRTMLQSAWIEEYPEYKNLIETVYIPSSYRGGASGFAGINTIDLMTERQKQETNYNASIYSSSKGNFIVGVEYYERIKEYEYIVVDAIEDKLLPFDTNQEAVDYMSGLKKGYSEGAVLLVDESGNDLVFISENTKDALYQTLVFGNQIAHRIQVNLPDFPYQICYAYFNDGTYWSPVDPLIDPQIMYNRMVAERDNQIARANKTFTTVIEPRLGGGQTVNTVIKAKSTTGAVLKVESHEAIKLWDNLPASPDFASTLAFVENFMTINVGGSNALGLQENAAESGKAVQFRQQAAGTAKLPLFDHLRLWRRKTTEMMVWYMKNFLDESQTIRIIGKNGKPEYIDLNDGIMGTIRELRTDILISEQTDTETSKQMQYQQTMELFKVAGDTIPAEVKITMMLEMSDIDPEKKAALLGQIQSYQQYQQQQMQTQHDDKLKQQASDSIQLSEIKAQMLGQPSPQVQQAQSGGTNGS